MAGYGGGAEGFKKFVTDKIAQGVAEADAVKNEQAKKMYEDAMANNALLQDMRNRASQQKAPVQNAMTGVTNSIANTALQNAGVAPAMAGGAIRSNYQGS